MEAIQKTLPAAARDLIKRLAYESPTLADLTPAQFEAVALAVLGDNLKREMERAVLAEKIKFGDEGAKFLEDQKSPHTKRAYTAALQTLKEYLDRNSFTLADLDPGRADDFIRDLLTHGKDEDTARLKIAALSSFFTFLERRYSEIRNPFRGTKVRPRSTWATATIPTPKEVKTILSRAEAGTRAALAIILETGLRIGALAELRIKPDGSFFTLSKGKRFEGFEPISQKTRDLIANAGLPVSRPWNPENHKGRKSHKGRQGKVEPEDLLTKTLATRINRHCKALRDAGDIAAAYSPHDFRHTFAEAHKGKGLVWLRDRLGHASIAVTEHYLSNTLGINTQGL